MPAEVKPDAPSPSPRRPGRPRRVEPLSERVSAALPTRVFDELCRRASSTGQSLSAVVRDALQESVKRLK
jgi:hypothetical protein